MQKIVNSIILNNEIWALQLRLPYEYQFFDRIFITESRTTFSGAKKILYFEKYKHLFESFLDKIEYIIVDKLPDVEYIAYLGHGDNLTMENRWPLEAYQRNYCKKYILEYLDCYNDIVVMQDADEIYPIKSLNNYKSQAIDHPYVALYYHDYRGSVYASNRSKDLFRGGYACNKAIFEQYDLHDIRRCYTEGDNVVTWHIVNPGSAKKLDGSPLYHKYKLNYNYCDDFNISQGIGWHFSNMTGGLQSILQNKFSSFSHSEYSPKQKLFADDIDFHKLYTDAVLLNKLSINLDMLDDKLPRFVRERVHSFPILFD